MRGDGAVTRPSRPKKARAPTVTDARANGRAATGRASPEEPPEIRRSAVTGLKRYCQIEASIRPIDGGNQVLVLAAGPRRLRQHYLGGPIRDGERPTAGAVLLQDQSHRGDVSGGRRRDRLRHVTIGLDPSRSRPSSRWLTECLRPPGWRCSPPSTGALLKKTSSAVSVLPFMSMAPAAFPENEPTAREQPEGRAVVAHFHDHPFLISAAARAVPSLLTMVFAPSPFRLRVGVVVVLSAVTLIETRMPSA